MTYRWYVMKMHGARGEEVAKVRRSAKDASAASELAFYRGHQEIVFCGGGTHGRNEGRNPESHGKISGKGYQISLPLEPRISPAQPLSTLVVGSSERLERLLNPMSRFLAYRLFIVLEKGL